MVKLSDQFDPQIPVIGARTLLKENEVERLVAAAFKDVRRPDPADRQALVVHGPSGGGKNTAATELFPTLPQGEVVYVSAGENGVMDAILALRGIKNPKPEQYRAHWAKFRNDRLYVRSLILAKALREGYSVLIDDTAGIQKTGKMAQALKGAGYRVTLYSYWAPLDVCTARVQNRPRGDHGQNLASTRLKAFKSFENLWAVASRAHIFYSTQAYLAPAEVLDVDLTQKPVHGTSPHPNLLGRMIADLRVSEGGLHLATRLNAIGGTQAILPVPGGPRPRL